MYRLYQFTLLDGTEGQSIYTYETELEAMADFHKKYGSQLKSPYYNAVCLIVLDNVGKVVDSAYHAMSDDYSISSRLITVEVTTDGETANASKYNSTDEILGNFHSKLGSAMDNESVLAEMLRGVDGKGNEIIFKYYVRPISVTEETTE